MNWGWAASRLGENRININYTYCGIEPGSTKVLVVSEWTI